MILWLNFARVGNCLQVGDIQFIGTVGTIRLTPRTHSPAMRPDNCRESFHPLLRDNTFEWPDPDTIVRCSEVKKCRCLSRRLNRGQPISQDTRIGIVNGIQQQWRQTELIHHVCFIMTVAKIADILLMRDIRFSEHQGSWNNLVENTPHQLDRRMCPGKMNAFSTGLLPQKSDCIETNDPGASTGIFDERLQHQVHDAWIRVIQIHLISAKGGPYIPCALR